LFLMFPSVSIVSDYRPDDRDSIPAEAKDFSSSRCVQTNSGAHTSSYPMGIGEPSPGEKRCRGVTLTCHPPSSAEVKNK
jgi:hypothetical protein